MKFGELQPYRVWFDYLKTCLLDEKLKKKVDKEYYKSWNLSEIKNSLHLTNGLKHILVYLHLKELLRLCLKFQIHKQLQ